MATTITAAAADAMSSALNVYINTGGAAKAIIYDGTVPASAGTAISTQNALATFTLNATAFTSSNGVLTLAGVPKTVSADLGGTATFFRITNSAGVAILQGAVGTSGQQLNLNTTIITAGVNVTITSGTITVPQS